MMSFSYSVGLRELSVKCAGHGTRVYVFWNGTMWKLLLLEVPRSRCEGILQRFGVCGSVLVYQRGVGFFAAGISQRVP